MIGIIDADLLCGRQRNFPNLAAMKLSAFHKQKGNDVRLLSSYTLPKSVQRVYVCCVFTNSAKSVPPAFLDSPRVRYGGTGFFFDKAKPLQPAIEHTRPDYTLYDEWIASKGMLPLDAKHYTDTSIGFLTRGCFRRCEFCVNRRYKRAVAASPLSEFYDPNRHYVCLLDDNLLAYRNHRELLTELAETCERDKTQFTLKQGIDIRILKPTTAKLLGSPAHFGEIIFAFDSLRDTDATRKGMTVLRDALPTKGAKAYVLCGFESQDALDIAGVFRRLEILWEYNCLGYVMRHESHKQAPLVCRAFYTVLAMWANQPRFQRSVSFRQFTKIIGGKSLRSATAFERQYPAIAERFFDVSYRQ